MIPDSEGMDLAAETLAGRASPSPATEPQPRPAPQDVQTEAAAPGEQAAVQPETDLASGSTAANPPGHSDALLVTICESMERLAASAERYHARAEQREGVIDHLHDEVDRLRRGERRGLLRPLLVEMGGCAMTCSARQRICPGTSMLTGPGCCSVPTPSPSNWPWRMAGSRRSRRKRVTVSSRGCTGAWAAKPRDDPDAVGRVARVRRSGYLDVDTNTPVAPAEVVLYVSATPWRRRALPVSTGQNPLLARGKSCE